MLEAKYFDSELSSKNFRPENRESNFITSTVNSGRDIGYLRGEVYLSTAAAFLTDLGTPGALWASTEIAKLKGSEYFQATLPFLDFSYGFGALTCLLVTIYAGREIKKYSEAKFALKNGQPTR